MKSKRTMPHACFEALIPFLRLPYPPSASYQRPKEDPKIWSLIHLSVYFSSTLRGAGAGEVPDQLTRDTTAFVNYTDTGEDVFSNEGDFDRYLPFLSLVFSLSLLLFLFLPSANIWFE